MAWLDDATRAELAAVAARHGCTMDELQSKLRFRALQTARRECYALLRDKGWSLAQTGRLFKRSRCAVYWVLQPEERKAREYARAQQRERERRAQWERRRVG